jgi:hypothetical protein
MWVLPKTNEPLLDYGPWGVGITMMHLVERAMQCIHQKCLPVRVARYKLVQLFVPWTGKHVQGGNHPIFQKGGKMKK